MPRAENTKAVTIYMSGDAIAQLNESAEQLGFKSSGEYVRDLIKRDMESRGQPIDFGLDTWGRKRKDDGDPPPDKPKRAGKKKAD